MEQRTKNILVPVIAALLVILAVATLNMSQPQQDDSLATQYKQRWQNLNPVTSRPALQP